MSSISFSLQDYRSGLSTGRYRPPATLCPYYEVDPVLYRQHGNSGQRRDHLRTALHEILKRTGRKYFTTTYALQARTLEYSARAFPAYRFILPEVMTEDWLAAVDWGKFHRDHVLHQSLCGYVVLRLLEDDRGLVLPDGKSLLDTCVEQILLWKGTGFIRDFLIECGMNKDSTILDPESPIARQVWRIFFREAAYVAAVFHDLGYPWNYAERMHRNLDGMNASAIKQNRNASQVRKLFGRRILFRVLQGYQIPDAASPSTWREKILRLTDTAMSKTHGFPGALGFLHLNDCVRRYPSPLKSPLQLLCVEWVAAAIMMHDMARMYWGERESSPAVPENSFLRLSFDKDPLSSIVTLADVIQDFERPTATFGTCNNGGKQHVTIGYDAECSGTDVILNGSSMIIEYKMMNSRARALKRMYLAKEEKEYFDAQYGYLDMRSLGINDVRVIVS